MRKLLPLIVLLLAMGGAAFAQDAPTIAVMTPFLAQPGTQLMVEAFEAAAADKDWRVNVIDTSEDIAALVSRMEDVALQGVDAIVINVDPTQIEPGLQAAAEAGIPVFGLDSGAHPLLATNVTSNGYAMAAETATYVVDRLNGAGDVVMFIFEPYPPVQKRGAIARAIFENSPDIRIMDAITPSFDNGPLEGARNAMEALLLAHPEAGSISAVWAAWDDPALGALQAIEDAGRAAEGIVIVGIDATDQARDAIARGSNFEATVAQDFIGMAARVAGLVEAHLGGMMSAQVNHYVPARLLTQADLMG
ncbi:MAG: substrate-binding domain-containing protein [Chloroflexi bacterium]|nr:substrate-binding domain-containing protein [Chloroflexota bacterium]MCY4246373.1 substrate-binding domain-containing protein [Chloroflexota bacterium]